MTRRRSQSTFHLRFSLHQTHTVYFAAIRADVQMDDNSTAQTALIHCINENENRQTHAKKSGRSFCLLLFCFVSLSSYSPPPPPSFLKNLRREAGETKKNTHATTAVLSEAVSKSKASNSQKTYSAAEILQHFQLFLFGSVSEKQKDSLRRRLSGSKQ